MVKGSLDKSTGLAGWRQPMGEPGGAWQAWEIQIAWGNITTEFVCNISVSILGVRWQLHLVVSTDT